MASGKIVIFSLRKPGALCVPALVILHLVQTVGVSADAVHHVDGTVVTGKIKNETPDVVTIETKYGPLTYDKTKVLKIERDADAAKAAAQKARATPVNYSNLIPQGPINPFAPPQIPPLAKLSVQVPSVQTTSSTSMTTATASAPGALPPPAQ